ncbi:MAG: DUF4870 domain-containing protein [Anaerolineales bacterium]
MSEQYSTGEITSDDKLWAALGYIFSPVIPIIMLLMEEKKARPFIKYHSIQSIAAFIVIFVLATITVGCGSVLILVMFYWAYKAYQGEYFEIPLLTNFMKNQGWI